MQTAYAFGYTIVALILLLPIGNELCRRLLEATRLKPGSAKGGGVTGQDGGQDSGQDSGQTGRVIGTLERLLLAAGIICQSWEVIAAVIALKTLARFKEMDRKDFAEYFLVGSIFSLL